MPANDGNGVQAVEKQFEIGHPTAAGHFPGNPIIPGAVLLDEVMQAVAARTDGGIGPYEIRSAKFLRPVRPGDRILIRWRIRPDGEIKFECLSMEPSALVLTGSVKLGGESP